MNPSPRKSEPDSLEPKGKKEQPNYSAVTQELGTAERGIRAFWDFVTRVRGFVAFGFIVGTVTAVCGDLLLGPHGSMDSSWSMFLATVSYHAIKDIGTGLIVSSIAVFGYDYLKHARGDFEQSRKLDGALVSLDDAVRTLATVGRSHNFLGQIKTDFEELRSNVTENTGRKVMDHFFSGTDAERRFRNNINRLVHYALELKRTHTIDSQLYLEFISWLCNRIARNVQSLSSVEGAPEKLFEDHIEDGDREQKDAMWAISWPSTKEVAAQISAHKMKGLGSGDYYNAVSNVFFWERGQMDCFLKQIELSCMERNVTVKRIFNLCNLQYIPGLLEQKFCVAKEIVASHLKLQEKTGGRYQVRFLGREQVAKAVESKDGLNPHNLMYSCFAIFKRTINGKADLVRYRTGDDELSSMTMSRSDARRYVERFDTLWDACEGLRNPFAGDIEEFINIMGETDSVIACTGSRPSHVPVGSVSARQSNRSGQRQRL